MMPRYQAPSRLSLPFLLVVLLLASCGGADRPGGQAGVVGSEATNPATGMPFIVDENQSGGSTNFRIAEIFWGRLVDVHQLMDDYDPNATEPPAVDPLPVFVDWVVSQNIVTDAVDNDLGRGTPAGLVGNYVLDQNPVTGGFRLVILANRDSTNDAEVARFRQLLDNTQLNFPFVLPKNDDGSSPGPFSFVARNACMVIRFNDCLDDSADAVATITERVKIRTGLPPTRPFSPRVIFDPNHGGLVSGAFHSTRILVDTVVSPEEAALLPDSPANALGFPASELGSHQPNVSVRIPTRIDFGSTQFNILTNRSGRGLHFDTNGPRDINAPTRDIVRAMRAGNPDDVHNGFVRDEIMPSVLGSFGLNMDFVVNDPDEDATAGIDFIADITFTSACETVPTEGDAVRVNGVVLIVSEAGNSMGGGSYDTVSLRASAPVPSGVSLLGGAEFLTRYDPAKVTGGTIDGCWVGFAPGPLSLPTTGVNPGAQVLLRFSEAMDPETVSPFRGFNVVEGPAPANEDPPAGDALVIGPLLPSPGLTQFGFDSTLPLNHENGTGETFHVRLRGATDLAGNELDFTLPFVDFTLDPSAPTSMTGGISLRFDSTDEIGAPGPDLRGQVIYQFGTSGGRLIPRQAIFATEVADGSQPVPGMMGTNILGVQDPLTPYGSKLQFVWRYCDFGFLVTDETKYNLDIVGLSWSPLQAGVISDNYEAFEIRLAHSMFLPDEVAIGSINMNFLTTGLAANGAPFSANILDDPRSPQMVVHPSSLGYRIDPTQQFMTTTGTTMMPYPYDPFANIGVGGVPETFTWRDTAVQALGGQQEVGIPMAAEQAAGTVYPDPDDPTLTLEPGQIAGTGMIPSYGLPLLVEIRCFPSNEGLGINLLNVKLAPTNPLTLSGIGAGTAMRAYTSGGLRSDGTIENRNPNDPMWNVPSGGFNPNSLPPNLQSAFQLDNQWYPGTLDTVIRVSRAHTIWLNASEPADFLLPVITPNPDTLPGGTSVVLEYRGAMRLENMGDLNAAQNADNLDPYGDIDPNQVQIMFLNEDNTWKTTPDDLLGAAMLQVRMSFVNNIETGESPHLDAFGIPFTLLP